VYFLSSFNKISYTGTTSVYKNIITERSVSIDNDTLFLINTKIVNQQVSNIENDLVKKLLQIITCELLYRGILIPIESKNSERSYLDSLILIQEPSSGSFFRSKVIPEYKIDLLEKDNLNVVFCGIPSDIGAKNPGSRFGPQLIRERSSSIFFRSKSKDPCLIDLRFEQNSFDFNFVYDFGDISLNRLNSEDSINKVKEVSKIISKNAVPFFIGGDHLFTLPIVEGLYEVRKKPFTFVQLDHHLDIQLWGDFKENKPEILTEPDHANFVSWIHHKIPELKIFQLGIDNYQSINKDNFNNITSYLNSLGSRITNLDILSQGLDQILQKLPKEEDIYLSIDVDVLNNSIMCATGYPAHTGINLEHFVMFVSYLCQRNNVIGVDLMEFGLSNNHSTHRSMSTLLITIILEILRKIVKK
jgi:arginase family enzyme